MKPAITLFLAALCFGQSTFPTGQVSNTRLAAATSEATLTPTNIADGTFGKRGSIALDGKIYTQVLYIPSLTIGGSAHNVILAGSANNTMYAWDAGNYGVLWSTNTGDASCVSSCSGFNWGLNYNNPVGVFSTPAVDVANGWVFFVTMNNAPIYQLYKMNLLTGAVISKVTLTASVSPSTAPDSSGGTLTFNPSKAIQRTALTIANGNVYVTFSSSRDVADWHGWIMARSESTLSDVADFCTNWNVDGGGIWMSNRGAAVDASGNIYVITGNGGTNSTTYTSSYNGVTEFSMSFLKLSSTLTLLDWFTPSNYATLNATDLDLGSSGPLLIPNPASSGNYLVVGAGKDYNVYSVHSECMGQLGGTANGCPGAQVFPTGSGSSFGVFGCMFMNSTLYCPNNSGLTYAFTLLSTGLFNTTPVTAQTVPFPGSQMTGSINGAANGIVWAVTPNASTLTAPSAGKLQAWNPATLAKIWSSGDLTANSLGNVQKFVQPTITNARVYVPTYDSVILVYGRLNQFAISN
jgi:hypothetical protein